MPIMPASIPTNQASNLTINEPIPPHSIEAEQALLGAIFLRPEVMNEVMVVVRDPEQFYRTAHQHIYDSMLRLNAEAREIDWISVEQDLLRQDLLQEAGGKDYLIQITELMATSASARQWAEVVRDKAILRSVIRSATSVRQRAFDAKIDPAALIEEFEGEVFKLGSARFHSQTHSLTSLIAQVQEQIAYFKRLRSENDAVPGLPSGFSDLDRITTGFKGGELLILAARPGHGKTSLALNIAENIAISAADRHNKRATKRGEDPESYKKPGGVLFFSLEMTGVELATRLVCSCARLSLRDVRSGMISRGQEQDLVEAEGLLQNAALFIDDSFNLTMAEVRAKSRRLKESADIEVVVVDYLQLIQGDLKLDRHEQIGMITRGLKALARELEIPVLAMAQLNRSIEQRTGARQRPMLSDLRESGSIEQDADMVMFIQRDNVLDNKKQDQQQKAKAQIEDADEREARFDVEPATLIIAKNRNGPVDDVRLMFRKSCTRFEKADAAALAAFESGLMESAV